MSRKWYELIASSVQHSRREIVSRKHNEAATQAMQVAVAILVNRLADDLKRSNAAFDRERFIVAALQD